jgi:LemA protein
MSLGTLVFVIIIGIALYFIAVYNKLVSLRTGINAAWSDIDIQLKRRYNLIPALIDTVKGYKSYEGDTLESVIEARQKALNAGTMEEKAAASGILSGTLGKLFALAESYPDLKANTNFLKLQDELGNLEDAIQNARRYYNAIVRDYNAKIESFPDLFVAQKFHFTKRNYFELEEKEAKAVKQMPEIKP